MNFRISLLSLIIVTSACGAILGIYLSRWRFQHDWENGYLLDQNINFFDFQCDVIVYAEENADGPSWRQRTLLSRLTRYSDESLVDDAAEKYRSQVDDNVFLSEYGLGHINRSNIREHYGISRIIISRQDGSPDDYVVLVGGCDWEEEHGLQLLIKNGHECVWCGGYENWERRKPWAMSN